MDELYIRLGSGKVQNRGVGNKGALLDKAAKAGIRVPEGVLILDTTWDQAVLYGLLEMEDVEQAYSPNPQKFIEFLQLPTFETKVAVRSAFSVEDDTSQSLAGYFESLLHIDANDPKALSDAIYRVISSAKKREGRFRNDILIMEMVDAQHAGVAFREHEYEDDLINYTTGTADKLLGGEVSGETLSLGKLRIWEQTLRGEKPTPWQSRLQVLIRETQRWLGKSKEWDIEWADDGEHCYLIQARPITRPTRRNEAFTIANHKEILPELPSVFMTSVIESCAADLFAYYQNFDSELPKTRPFIEVFKGRPYINLSLMSEMMRVFGLPTRLVTDNIGGETDRVYGMNLWRMVNKSINLTLPRFALAQLLAVQSAKSTTKKLDRRMIDLGDNFTELTENMRWMYTTLVTEMFSLTAAIGPMLSLLRRVGTLEEHNTRQQTISTQMFTDLDPLRQYVAGRADIRVQLEQGELPTEDEGFMTLWQAYIDKYGHRGIYESDIARPRYREKPEPLLVSLAMPAAKRPTKPKRTALGMLTLPLWWQAGRTMRAREQWRHDMMRGFEALREELTLLARAYVRKGILPNKDALWMMTLDEVRQLDAGWQPEADFFTQRQAEIEDLKGYHLPDLLYRNADLEAYREYSNGVVPHERLSGISLTTGEINGKAWVLREPALELPQGFDQNNIILIARSVDAGWIPTFSRVAGVVVETGGDLSHGSIILREIGLPAITNVREVTLHLTTGDDVSLHAGSGVVERL